MEKEENQNPYHELEERAFKFAKDCRNYVKRLSRTQSNIEYGKQLIRSSGSVAANYIEANEAVNKKDFYHRAKISRKEAKESRLWLRLSVPNTTEEKEQERLIQEALELTKIFASMTKNK